MQIVELKVEGYRTLKNVSWKPGNLNIVIGPNASGKSNLLRLFTSIRQSSWGSLSDDINHSGGIGALIWNGQGELLSFVLTLDDRQEGEKKLFVYSLYLKRLGASNSYIIVRENLVSVDETEENRLKLNEVYLQRNDRGAIFSNGGDHQEVDASAIDGVETFLSQIKNIPRKSQHIGQIYRDLSSFGIYQEFRSDRNARIRQPVISSFEEQLEVDGQNLASVLHTVYESDIDFQENIDRAMTAAFGEDYKGLVFPPAGSQRIELGLRWKSLSRLQPAAVLSDGTLRFLFLITALSLPKLPSLICIDEPETGLHPSMLPIIAEYAANAAQRTQVVLTTHSVQFLDAFSEYAPTTTVAQMQNGETKLVTLDGEKLAYWLKNYTLGALFNSGELENMAQDALEDEVADDNVSEAVPEDGE